MLKRSGSSSSPMCYGYQDFMFQTRGKKLSNPALPPSKHFQKDVTNESLQGTKSGGRASKERHARNQNNVRKNEESRLDHRQNVTGCTKGCFSHVNKESSRSPDNDDRIEMSDNFIFKRN